MFWNQIFRKLETPLNAARGVEFSLNLKDLGVHLNWSPLLVFFEKLSYIYHVVHDLFGSFEMAAGGFNL